MEPQHQTGANMARNFFFGLSTWILPLGLSFIATPIIVNSLGHEDYGIYALVLGFVGYSFAFSIGRTLVKYVAEYRITGRADKINDIVSATLIINLIVGIIGVILLAGLADWYAADISLLTGESRTKAVYALYIAAVIVFVTMTGQVFDGILQGLHRYDLFSRIFNLNGILLTLGNLSLAWFGFGLHSLLLWNVVVAFITLAAYALTSIRLLPGFRLNFAVGRSDYRLVLAFSYGLIGYQLISNFILLFERAWISRKFGVEAVTIYVVPMTIGLYIHGFISSVLLAIFPAASELRDNKERLLLLYHKATKIAAVIVLFIGTSVVVESRLFLELWMGPNFAAEASVLLVLHTAGYSLLAILVVAWRIAEGLGHTAYNFFIFTVCFVVTIGLMFALTAEYGLTGVAAARAIGFGILFLSVYYFEYWTFRAVQWKLWAAIILKAGIAAVLAGLTQKLLNENLSFGWLGFILALAVSGAVYLATLLILRFPDRDEMDLVRSQLRRLRRN